MKKFYITTTLPYVNAKPHIGFALEIVRADILARYHRLIGDDVIFNTGSDEHGIKIYRKAALENRDIQEYVDESAEEFKKLKEFLNLSYTNFTRTTDSQHKAAAQKFWQLCDSNGDIYKKIYKIKYCIGCELEKTDSELIDGCCPLHPNIPLEEIDEENYFFRFSNYAQRLLDFYAANPNFVVPDQRYNEIKKFVESGLSDFSISRLKSKMPWGVSIPGDDDQVMYVWFDALVNYISVLGWPDNQKNFKDFWPGVQIAGKDNLRQQSAMWQAMLMSAGLPNSKQIVIDGFINVNGQKMSKSLGNVIDPIELVNNYGTDALRYWFAREMNNFEDGDFTLEKFETAYNANLANGIGNLASRIIKMAQNAELKLENPAYVYQRNQYLEDYLIKDAADEIWKEIAGLNAFIQTTEPFKTIKTDPEKAKKDILFLLEKLYMVGVQLEPFLPETSEKIKAMLRYEETGALFPRLAE